MNAHWIQPTDEVRYLYCEDCGTHTNHRRAGDSHEFLCWCARVVTVPDDEAAEQVRILQNITPEAHADFMAAVFAELEADHADWLDEMQTRESNRPF